MSKQQPIRIALAGASGRMGTELLRLIGVRPDRYRLVGAWVGQSSHALGRDAGEVAGIDSQGIVCTTIGNVNDGVDAVIDFSLPVAAREVSDAVVALKAAWVCGVTGLDDEESDLVNRVAEKAPVLHADNFSIGIAVLAELAALAKERLGDSFDIEIDEAHHRAKRDAPSGTARMLGRVLGDQVGRIRTGPRESGEIGYSVRRGGGVRGEHTVYFLGQNERIELTHLAEDQALFANGALRAADWLMARSPGRYTLRDTVACHRAEP